MKLHYITIVLVMLSMQCKDVVHKQKAKNYVLRLTDQSFETAVKRYPVLFVDFYAPWCGVCKKFNPRWKALAEDYAIKNATVKFASINADKYRNMAVQYDIAGYPTLMLFYRGDRYIYEEAYEETLLDEFLTRILKNPAPETNNILELIKSTEKLAVYITDTRIGPQMEAFEYAARSVRFMKFVTTANSSDLHQLLKDKAGPVFLIKRYGLEIIPFRGVITAAALTMFFSSYK